MKYSVGKWMGSGRQISGVHETSWVPFFACTPDNYMGVETVVRLNLTGFHFHLECGISKNWNAIRVLQTVIKTCMPIYSKDMTLGKGSHFYILNKEAG